MQDMPNVLKTVVSSAGGRRRCFPRWIRTCDHAFQASLSSAITCLIYLVTIWKLDSISEASEFCWDKTFQAYGSTKSMLSGMKGFQWDVWLEASGVPADHCGVAMGILKQRIDSVGAANRL